MNKTVNINLGGMFFHIDEDAYQKLTRYFDAIKRSLTNSNGKDEIIKDIEMRIAELVSDKHAGGKQVISLKELDEIIAVMGQPEDYRIDPDGDEERANTTDFNSTTSTSTKKKLYRDKDGGMIGGVLSGLGYYFGIDKVWLRIILVLLVSFYGTGILAYIILWIVMPEAVTTTEKLEMMGEPVTISNIEKKIREEFDSVSENFKNAKVGDNVKNNLSKAGSSFGDFILTILKIFAKFLGVMLIMGSMTVLVMLFIGIFAVGTIGIEYPWQEFILSGNFSDYPTWSFGLLMFIAVGIPFFFLALLGFKLLSPDMKSIGRIASFTLLALWAIAIGICISIGIRQATEFAVEGRVKQKVQIPLQLNDTLQIKFKYNDYFAKDLNDHKEFFITEDSLGNNVVYSNNIRLRIMKTDEKVAYLEIAREASGKSLLAAKKTAEKINYGYEIKGNQLILDNYLLTDFKNKYREQEVELTLYLPVGMLFKPDSSVEDFDYSDDSYFNLHFSDDKYIYRVDESQIKCLNCPADENEWNDVEGEINIETENDSTSHVITIGENGILVKKNKEEEVKEVKSVKVNKDGITIKTE